MESLYFVGHSLGGALAKIVAAQIYRALEDGYIVNTVDHDLIDDVDIKAFATAAPGLSFGARKFSVHIEDIYKTALEIRPELDWISALDEHAGAVHFVECPAHNRLECHRGFTTICQMMSDCNVYRLHNPDLVAKWCSAQDLTTLMMNAWDL